MQGPHRLSLVVFLALLAFAETTTAAPSEGEQLFREGRAAMQAKDFDRACTKFAESQTKEPAPGTALNLGECEEQRGHLVAAYEAFMIAASTFTTADKQKYASSRAETLDRRIPRLVVRASSPVAGLAVRAGTSALPLDTEVRMDPGDLTIRAEAPGYLGKDLPAALREGRTLDVDVGVLTPSKTQATESQKPTAVIAPPAEPASPNTQRTIGLVVASIGAAAMVVGGVTGIMTLDRASTVKEHCDENLACDPEGHDAAQSGETLSLVSTITLAAGGAALLGGGILYFTAKNTSLAPTTSRSSFGLSLRTTF